MQVVEIFTENKTFRIKKEEQVILRLIRRNKRPSPDFFKLLDDELDDLLSRDIRKRI